MARCPYCKQEFSADTMEAETDRSKTYKVFTCPNPDCNMVLGIAK
jgi:hypothetical protein